MATDIGSDWDAVWEGSWQPERELWPPERQVAELAARLKEEGRTRVHDLGCGVGRHLLLLAAEGFEISGSDISKAAVEAARRRLREAGVSAPVTQCDMRAIPEPDGSLDAVIAWDVVFHAPLDGIRQAVEEARAKLREGGYFLVTFNSREHRHYVSSRETVARGEAQEIEPDTFVVPEGDGDKRVPHHYTTEEEIRERLLDGFTVISMGDSDHTPGKWWVLARKE